jgi:peptide/nickel transport system substrate-binding protein
MARGGNDDSCCALVYETLWNQLLDGTIKPVLAKSWEYRAEDFTYIVHLDERAKFSDGEPVTADDVKFTFDTQFKYDFPAGSRVKPFVRSVEVIDAHTVNFKLTEPIGSFVPNVSGVYIVPKHIWSKIQDPAMYDNPNPLGSGPFLFKEYKPNAYFYAVANKDYWRCPVQIDGVMMMIYLNPEAAVLALRKGEIDAVSDLMGLYSLVPTLLAEGIQVFVDKNTNSPCNIMINHRRYPNNIKEFRQAVSIAIDRKLIIEQAMRGYAMPPQMCPIAPSVTKWVNPKAAWPGWDMTEEDRISKANAMLDELGFKRGADGIRVTPEGKRLEFELLIGAFPSHQNAAAIVKIDMEKIGIKITLKIAESFFAIVWCEKPDFDWALSDWGGGKPADPDYLVSEYGADPPNPWFDSCAQGWENDEIQGMLRQSRRETDETKRWELIQKVQEGFAEELPSIILYHPLLVGAYRTDRFEGWSPTGMFCLEGVWALSSIETIMSLRPK